MLQLYVKVMEYRSDDVSVLNARMPGWYYFDQCYLIYNYIYKSYYYYNTVYGFLLLSKLPSEMH